MSKLDLSTMKDDVRNGFYEILDDVNYGEYKLDIVSESHVVTMVLRDDVGRAVYRMIEDKFLAIESTEELEKLLDSALYYNYIFDEIE